MTEPLVSIVMPFLNAEQFIEEAVQSIFDQTYQDWELIFVDDGSSDASTSIALRYAEQHGDKVRYTQHKGHGNRESPPPEMPESGTREESILRSSTRTMSG